MPLIDLVFAVVSAVFAIPMLAWVIADLFLSYYCFQETGSLWAFLSPFEAIAWATGEAREDLTIAFWVRIYKWGAIGLITYLLLLMAYIILKE